MKIDVIIPSRARDQSLASVIVALQAMESGANDVRYTVLCDEDDIATRAVAMTLRDIEIRCVCTPRGLVHKRVNEIIEKSPADVFMPWADDLHCMAAHWDEVTAKALAKVPAFSWQEVQDPENHTAIVCERKWLAAVGRFFPEHFPFWFADTWLKEVFGLVYGQGMPIIEYLRFSHKRTPTQGMRDLEFWFRVFAFTRKERIAEAKRIAAAYGVPWCEKPEIIAMFEQADALQIERVPQYEQAFGANQGDVTPTYLVAKLRAEAMMRPENVFAEAA